MKTNRIIIGVLSLFAVLSCAELESSNEQLQPEPQYFIYAQAPQTKTSLGQAGTDGVTPVNWKKEDAIKVITADGNLVPSDYVNSVDGAEAIFGGNDPITDTDLTKVRAVYPSSSYSIATAADMTINIPSGQIGVVNNLPVGTNGMALNPAYAFGATPVEGKPDSYKMTFYNIAGLIKIHIPAYLENITSIEISAKEGALAGDFALSIYEKGDEKLIGKVKEFKPAGNNVSKITLSAEKLPNQVFAEGDYYISVAPGNYKGFSVTFNTAIGGTFVKTLKPGYTLPINKSMITDLGTPVAAPAVGDYFLADGTWASAKKYTETAAGQVLIAPGVKKDVIGYVFSTDNSRIGEDIMKHEDSKFLSSLSDKLSKRVADHFHGYVIRKEVGNPVAWKSAGSFGSGIAKMNLDNPCSSRTNSTLADLKDAYTYWSYNENDSTTENTNHSKLKGYVNTLYWKTDHSSFDFIKTLPQSPVNTSGWYIPSTGDALSLGQNKAFSKLNSLSGKTFWTSSIAHKGLQEDYPIAYTISDNKVSFTYKWDGRRDERNIIYMLAF